MEESIPLERASVSLSDKFSITVLIVRGEASYTAEGKIAR